MENLNDIVFYVTSRGSYKGTNGRLYQPGEVFPPSAAPDAKVWQALIDQGTIAADLAEAFKVPTPITQMPLPMNEAGSDDASIAPATSRRTNDGEQRSALRTAQQAAKEGVEILGAGPVRVENKEIQPVTKTDPSNLTMADLAGQNLSVEEFNALKN